MVRVREFAAVSAMVFATAGAMGLVHNAWPRLQPIMERLREPANSAANTVAVPYVSIALAPTAATKPLVLADADEINPDAQGQAVAARLKDSVPRGLFGYFDLYLYVSKAAHGPWAQHMFILHKDDDGNLVYERSLPVSTGRERREKYFTTTPAGIFQLDAARFDRVHFSREWHHAPMPWAMFLKYRIHGHMTGIAVHSGVGHVAELGHRASGGCIRLPPRAARLLFRRIQREEYGSVPVFAFDAARDTTNIDGLVLRDDSGAPVLTQGYRVLLLVQNYPGGPLEVAEL